MYKYIPMSKQNDDILTDIADPLKYIIIKI